MAERFMNNVAMVTGAGNGMGAATVRMFAAEGASVGVVDYNAEACRTVAEEISRAGGQAVAIEADIRRAADAHRAVRELVQAFGGLDILVNNAGVVRYGTVPDFSEDDRDLVVNTNLKGVFLMSKAAIPEMRKRGGGAIINASSTQAFASQQLVAAYSASKGGVLSMTRTMALDHARESIRVNCYCPGSVETAMLRYGAEVMAPDDPGGAMEEWGRNHPIGRVIQPDEVAKVILFLASEDASAITGAPHIVDGGLLARLGV